MPYTEDLKIPASLFLQLLNVGKDPMKNMEAVKYLIENGHIKNLYDAIYGSCSYDQDTTTKIFLTIYSEMGPELKAKTNEFLLEHDAFFSQKMIEEALHGYAWHYCSPFDFKGPYNGYSIDQIKNFAEILFCTVKNKDQLSRTISIARLIELHKNKAEFRGIIKHLEKIAENLPIAEGNATHEAPLGGGGGAGTALTADEDHSATLHDQVMGTDGPEGVADFGA